MNPWATTSDVLSVTGVTCTDTDIAQASNILDVLTGVGGLDQTKMKARDLRMMKMAVAYQVAWMKEQPDLFSRHDVTALGHKGIAGVAPRDVTTFILAPLAKQALRRCTWSQIQTKSVLPFINWHDRMREEMVEDGGPLGLRWEQI